MFARTPRLLLRPGFPEDAPALASAISDEAIVRNLAAVPWPYSIRDAEAFLAKPRDPILPSLLIFERGPAAPLLVGACGLGRRPSGSVEMGYWIARAFWGSGYATEACVRWSTSPGPWACRVSRARTSSTTPLPDACSRSSVSKRWALWRRGCAAPGARKFRHG